MQFFNLIEGQRLERKGKKTTIGFYEGIERYSPEDVEQNRSTYRRRCMQVQDMENK